MPIADDWLEVIIIDKIDQQKRADSAPFVTPQLQSSECYEPQSAYICWSILSMVIIVLLLGPSTDWAQYHTIFNDNFSKKGDFYRF